jgi:hypothetical protein
MYGSIERVRELLSGRVAITDTPSTTVGVSSVSVDLATKTISEQDSFIDGMLGSVYTIPLPTQFHSLLSMISSHRSAAMILALATHNNLENSPEGQYYTILMEEATKTLDLIVSKKLQIPDATLQKVQANRTVCSVVDRESFNPFAKYAN